MSKRAKRPPVPVEAVEANRPVDTAKDEELFQHFISNQKTYIERLTEFVAIPGVSAEPARRPEVVRAVEWFKGWCDKLGGNTMLKELGEQSPGLDLPPVLLAEFGADPNKKTLVVYGHLDVQPAAISDGWDTDPWVLTEKNGQLFGRGATDDKGPTTAWLWVSPRETKIDRARV